MFGNYTNVSNTAIINIYVSSKFGIESTDRNFTIASAKSIHVRQVIEHRYGYIKHRALWILSKDNGAIL